VKIQSTDSPIQTRVLATVKHLTIWNLYKRTNISISIMISYRLNMRVKPNVEKPFRGNGVIVPTSIRTFREVAYNSTLHSNSSEFSWSSTNPIFNVNEVEIQVSKILLQWSVVMDKKSSELPHARTKNYLFCSSSASEQPVFIFLRLRGQNQIWIVYLCSNRGLWKEAFSQSSPNMLSQIQADHFVGGHFNRTSLPTSATMASLCILTHPTYSTRRVTEAAKTKWISFLGKPPPQ
jgi:hypothetical protein